MLHGFDDNIITSLVAENGGIKLQAKGQYPEILPSTTPPLNLENGCSVAQGNIYAAPFFYGDSGRQIEGWMGPAAPTNKNELSKLVNQGYRYVYGKDRTLPSRTDLLTRPSQNLVSGGGRQERTDLLWHCTGAQEGQVYVMHFPFFLKPDYYQLSSNRGERERSAMNMDRAWRSMGSVRRLVAFMAIAGWFQ